MTKFLLAVPIAFFAIIGFVFGGFGVLFLLVMESLIDVYQGKKNKTNFNQKLKKFFDYK
jgi:hypothetical protein